MMKITLLDWSKKQKQYTRLISGKDGNAGAIGNSWSHTEEVLGNMALGQKLSIFYVINLPNSPSWSRWFYPILKIRKLKLKEVDLRGNCQSQDSRPGLSDHKACVLNTASHCLFESYLEFVGIPTSLYVISNLNLIGKKEGSEWRARKRGRT